MNVSWPAPFPDTARDRRSPEQREADRAATEEQSRLLGDSISAETIDEDLARLFADRRADLGDKVVQFEVTPTDSGQQTLVVRDELLVRRSPGQEDDPRVWEILREYGFLDSADSRADDTAGHSAGDPAGLGVGCPELEPYLSRHLAPGVSPPRRREAAKELAGIGVAASLTTVQVLQPRPKPIVVKSTSGPARSSVEDAALHAEVADGLAKRRVLVAVVDTGIAAEVRADGWLTDVPRPPLAASNIDPLDVFPPVGVPPTGGNGYLDFGAGHGTFAAGIVRQVEPHADIRVYSALDSDGLGSELSLACAMIQAAKDGAEVINLSLGMRTVDAQPPLALEAALDVIDELSECRQAPVLVAAAGNFGDDLPVWPAASRRVVAVAGLTATGPAPWSSHGVWVDCAAIGEGVVSTYVAGTEDPVFGGTDTFPESAWAVWTGTSFAAPQICGAIARVMRETGLDPRTAARRLIRSGTPIPSYGRGLVILPGS